LVDDPANTTDGVGGLQDGTALSFVLKASGESGLASGD
jgi:hypothetical protein